MIPGRGEAAVRASYGAGTGASSLLHQRLLVSIALSHLQQEKNQSDDHSQTADGRAERGEVGKCHDRFPLNLSSG